MALTQNFKVNQLSKDLGMKSKDLMEMLASHGIEAKTQSALEPDEFGILLNVLTKDNQISGIEDYLDGITYIPSKKKKEAKPAEAAPAATAVPSEKAEPVVEEKPEPKVEKADEDQEFEVLKDNEVQVLGTVTREMLVELADATKQPTLSVKAYAVQYDEAIETISTAASA